MYGISNSQQGVGGSTINYTKLIGNVEFTVSSPSASSAFFVNTNAATWATNETFGSKTLTSTSDLGLVIGNSYTMAATIDGISYTFSGTATDATAVGLPGVKILGLENESKGSFAIYDHCDLSAGYPKAGNGASIIEQLDETPASATITTFSGTLRVVSPATITNSAIKVNSSVTMYINSSLVVSGTKTDGSITLDANNGGVVSYEMEILDTPTEGLFKIVNAYVPTVPTKTSELSNDSNFATISDIPTKTSELTNDSNFATTSDVPTKTSELTNDSGFITESDIPTIPTKTSQLTNDSGFITSSDIPTIPTKTSQLTNDSGFITASDIPTKTSELTNDSGFITKDNFVAGDNIIITNENDNLIISATGGVSSELVTTLKGTEIIKTFDNLDGCELIKGDTADGYIYC